MSVIVKAKKSFNQIQLDNVTNIAFTSGNYVITYGSPAQTATYAAASYTVTIMFKEV